MARGFLNLGGFVVGEGHRNPAITRSVGHGAIAIVAGVRLGYLADGHHGLHFAHSRLDLVLVNRLPYVAWPMAVQLVWIVVVQKVIQAEGLVAPFHLSHRDSVLLGVVWLTKDQKDVL